MRKVKLPIMIHPPIDSGTKHLCDFIVTERDIQENISAYNERVLQLIRLSVERGDYGQIGATCGYEINGCFLHLINLEIKLAFLQDGRALQKEPSFSSRLRNWFFSALKSFRFFYAAPQISPKMSRNKLPEPSALSVLLSFFLLILTWIYFVTR